MHPSDAAIDPAPDRSARPDALDSPAPEPTLRALSEEAVRLLGADGAIVYLLEPGTRHLVFVAEASAADRAPGRWHATIHLDVGTGLAGRAVAERRVGVTDDYAADTNFIHTAAADEFARETGLRSFVVAPLVAGDDVFGALGVYAREVAAFSDQQVALVRALADHAALATANARLIAELDRARLTTSRQADVERSLRELGTRISGASDLAAVVQSTIDEAQRLLGGDGGRIDIVDHESNALQGIYASGRELSVGADWPYDPDDSLEVGVSGRAVVTGVTTMTADYLADTSIVHGSGPDAYVLARGIRSVIASPLTGEDGAFGAITVWSCRVDAFDAGDASLLETIAGQAAVALVRARLIDDLGRSREELARRADEERALYDLARRSMAASGPAGPAGVLADVADVAARLLGPLGAIIEVSWPAAGRGAVRLAADLDEADVAAWRLDAGSEAVARAVSTQRVVTGGTSGSGPVRSWAVAPLIGESSTFGSIAVLSDETDRYGTADTELLGALADHAAIAIARADLLERLAESEDRYRSLIENLPDLVFTCAADGTFTFISASVEPLLGWSAEELVGHHFRDLIPPHPDGSPTGERFHALMANPTYKLTTRFELRTAFGFNRPVEVSAAPIVRDGRFAGVHGSVRDVSERERLEADLRRQAADLAAAEERAHLARELHDSVTQALFSMTLQVRSVELLLARDPALVAGKLAELRELQRDALAEMRALIFELRPGNLAEAGLVEALRTHAAGVSGRLGLPIVVESDLPERPDIETEEALYRIAQEALHNIVKHAGAHEARVELVRLGPDVRLLVTDDGHGFDLDAVPDGHLGLAGMRARAERLSGTFAVTSALGRGTQVQAIVPNVPPVWGGRTLSGAGVASRGTGRRP